MSTTVAARARQLPPLPALRDFLHIYRLQAKKILSQNYLMDMNITRKIVRAIKPKPPRKRKSIAGEITQPRERIIFTLKGMTAIEVGPGPGGITRALLEADADKVHAIEVDSRFVPPLEHLGEAVPGRLHVHRADALRVDVESMLSEEGATASQPIDWHSDEQPPLCLIGNLPFHIASPLIIRYLRDMSYRRQAWKWGRVPLVLTFQSEVGRRICAPAYDQESRSRLSVMAQYVTRPQLVFEIPGKCFTPAPDVDVAVVRFEPRPTPLIPVAFEVVEKLVRCIFHYRNKYMINGLRDLYPKERSHALAEEVLSEAGVERTMTATQITVEEYGRMAKVYEAQCRRIPGLFPYDYIRPQHDIEELAKSPRALPPECIYKNEPLIMPPEGTAGAEQPLSATHPELY